MESDDNLLGMFEFMVVCAKIAAAVCHVTWHTFGAETHSATTFNQKIIYASALHKLMWWYDGMMCFDITSITVKNQYHF